MKTETLEYFDRHCWLCEGENPEVKMLETDNINLPLCENHFRPVASFSDHEWARIAGIRSMILDPLA